LLELRQAAENAGPNGAEWDFEDIRDLFVRIILEIKEAERRPVGFLALSEELEHAAVGLRRTLAQVVAGDDEQALAREVLEPLLELEPVVVSVERDGAPGEADGVRSVPGRLPTRSLRDSLQPAIIVAPRATAKTALSNFFISVLLLMAVFAGLCGCNASATYRVPWYTRSPFISHARHRRSNR